MIKHLDSIHDQIDINENNHKELIKGAMTALGSKVVSYNQEYLAKIE